MNSFTVGIVGLGLIGASFAKAFTTNASNVRVLACNRTQKTVQRAITEGVIHGELTDSSIPDCDLLLISLYPEAGVKFLREKAHLIKPGAIVTDACGTKRLICAAGFAIAKEEGTFSFIGAHPMAGVEFSGYDYSRSDMFEGASMLLVPDPDKDQGATEAELGRLKTMFEPALFGRFVVTDPEMHDSMISYTSQMAHVISNCYIKSPSSLTCSGFTGGSFRDLTRVSRLNPGMWTELFLANRDNLVREIKQLTTELTKVSDALEDGDADTLKALLEEGVRMKEESEKCEE
ncbi:MAG: prephenate dehydrogenase [Saccharofermentans sp.]|nr:prephenate dehydrogenase [Saccharofermentans sp.]